jgi:hypothetical protein
MANGFNVFGVQVPRVYTKNEGPPAPYQTLPANGLNFAGMQNSTAIHTQTQSNGELVALAATIVLAQASGVFDYDVDVCFADNTDSKTVRLRAVLVPGGPGGFTGEGPPQGASLGFSQSVGSINGELPIAGSAAIAFVSNGIGTEVQEIVANQLNQDSTGLSAKGLLFFNSELGTTTPFAPIDTVENAIILWDQEIDTLTGELSNGDSAFHAHGRCGWGLGDAAPGFGVGNYAVLVLELVSTAAEEGADVITFGSCSMSLAEVG